MNNAFCFNAEIAFDQRNDEHHTAIHEAGHVIVAEHLEFPVLGGVSIIGNSFSAGRAGVHDLMDWNPEIAEQIAQVNCAGVAALRCLGVDELSSTYGAQQDFDETAALINDHALPELEVHIKNAEAILSIPNNALKLKILANHLLHFKKISWDHVILIPDIVSGELSEPEFWYALELIENSLIISKQETDSGS